MRCKKHIPPAFTSSDWKHKLYVDWREENYGHKLYKDETTGKEALTCALKTSKKECKITCKRPQPTGIHRNARTDQINRAKRITNNRFISNGELNTS